MPNKFTPQELLQRALVLLGEDYDAENDSFFVVITKDGKLPEALVGDQQIIGELNLKTVIAFINEAITQLCATFGRHPYTFIVRHILSHFIDQERVVLNEVLMSRATLGDMSPGEVLALQALEDEGEDVDTGARAFIVNPAMDEVNN